MLHEGFDLVMGNRVAGGDNGARSAGNMNRLFSRPSWTARETMNFWSASFRARTWWLVGGTFVLVKLWLVAGQTIYAIGPSQHDDRLFLSLAASILEGKWLGPYYQLTLSKGPMYPIWIALVFLTGVPLFTAQHLLYAAACAVFV